MSVAQKSRTWIVTTLFFLLLLVTAVLVLPFFSRTEYTNGEVAVPDTFLGTTTPKVVATHLPTPEPLKGIYMTACVAATPSWRESLKKLIEDTELNAVVIDIKDSTGVISFNDESLQVNDMKSGCKVADLREFIEELHESNIFVIGRISVFQDPYYTSLHPELAVKSKSTGGVWKDRKGLSFVDVGAKEYWDYILKLSRASYDLGFDELNFDYIRYPSDGNMSDTLFTHTHSTGSGLTSSTVVASSDTGSTSSPQAASTTSSQVRTLTKEEMLEKFFAYLSKELRTPSTGSGQVPVLSADLFGMVTTVENGMGIGQVLERALPYFDYIAPMVYPSHYPAGWNGFANPAENPYEVIKIAMSRAVEREVAWNVSQGRASSTPSKLRPWLQDFNLGATYDANMVRTQIDATYDSGLTSWLLWNAGNRYTAGALDKSENAVVER